MNGIGLTNLCEYNVVRGIYLPLTDTPTIGNYENPVQAASGVFYQEGVVYCAIA